MTKEKIFTPKERAWELINGFKDRLWEKGFEISKPMIKECALHAAGLILPVAKVADGSLPRWVREEYPDELGWEEYWAQVIEEIKNA